MYPNASREEIVLRIRAVADVIERALPRQVPLAPFLLPWETVAPTLMARMAGQGRSISTLLEGGHELDAEVVMRSLLEHLLLFSWLAITPDDASRKWKARDPASNTEWWMVVQAQREKRLIEDRQKWLDVLDDELRAGIRAAKRELGDVEIPEGRFPRVEDMAEEVHAHWAGRVLGWPAAEPRTAQFASTATGLYWTLYTRGNASVHPDYGVIRTFLHPLPYFDSRKASVRPERAGDRVSVFAGYAAFLLATAATVADEVLGWGIHPAAMDAIGRFEHAVGPGFLVAWVRAIVEGDTARYASVDARRLRVAVRDGVVSVTVVEAGSWTTLEYAPERTEWTLVHSGGGRERLGPENDERFGAQIDRHLELLAAVDRQWSAEPPSAWPRGA